MVGFTLAIADTGQTPYTGSPSPSQAALPTTRSTTTTPRHGRRGVLRQPGADLDRGPGAGRPATVTFTVTVNDPDTGDKLLSSPRLGRGGVDLPGRHDRRAVPLHGPRAHPGAGDRGHRRCPTVVPGGTVDYTVTITDTGQTPYTGITVTDDLTGLLDDATYNGNAPRPPGRSRSPART